MWDYLVVDSKGASFTAAELNNWGKERWRLVTVIQRTNSRQSAYFMRPAPPND
jgi:hypothetical protein